MFGARHLTLIIIGAAVTSLLLLGVTSTFHVFGQKEKYKAKLSGKNEVPRVNTPAKGSVSLKSKKDMMTWKLNVTGISNATTAQIYFGNKSENGKPIIDLMKSSNRSQTPVGMLMNGNFSSSDLQGPMQGKTLEDVKSAMAEGHTYVNIVTNNHPSGEIRGQIKISGAAANQTKIVANASNSSNTTQMDNITIES
ncbi:MAG TPA: CHRD domain-containing protein [Nitrososphaeraceae archaeon]